MGLDMLYCNAIYEREAKKLSGNEQAIKDLTK
jgi:hypothetical protein